MEDIPLGRIVSGYEKEVDWTVAWVSSYLGSSDQVAFSKSGAHVKFFPTRALAPWFLDDSLVFHAGRLPFLPHYMNHALDRWRLTWQLRVRAIWGFLIRGNLTTLEG